MNQFSENGFTNLQAGGQSWHSLDFWQSWGSRKLKAWFSMQAPITFGTQKFRKFFLYKTNIHTISDAGYCSLPLNWASLGVVLGISSTQLELMQGGTNFDLPLALSIIDVIGNKVQIRKWEFSWSSSIAIFFPMKLFEIWYSTIYTLFYALYIYIFSPLFPSLYIS